jgi:mono/diheme cytochrome c family protein
MRSLPFALLIAMLPLAAQQKTTPKTVPQVSGIGLISRPPPAAAMVERGRKLYGSACAFCHGSTGKGSERGPDLMRSAAVLKDEGGNLIGTIVTQGRGNMPALSLTKTQISELAAHLRFQTQVVIDRLSYDILNVVTGDPALGEAFFRGAGGCTACHSATGDLAHIGGKYEPVKLQSQMLYPRNVSSANARAVTVTFATGEKISGPLIYIDDFNVTLRTPAGERRSFSRAGMTAAVRDPIAPHAALLGGYADADMHNLLAYLVKLK